MMTFLFIMCLIVAGMLVRINFFLIFPPIIIAYIIARFTNFTKVSDRECMAIIVSVIIAASAFFVIKSWV